MFAHFSTASYHELGNLFVRTSARLHAVDPSLPIPKANCRALAIQSDCTILAAAKSAVKEYVTSASFTLSIYYNG